jgi:site-specific DNA recombinase
VRQVFDWVGRQRLSIGEVCRRLMQAGERTRTGRTVWDRSVVWEMLKNPAYMGSAAFGKTRQGPLRPRLRAQRGKPLQARQATSVYDVPREDWILIPVPAVVELAVFEAVQAQLEDNRRHARQTRRGARYLLQGLLQCQHCGYAFYGKPLSPSTRKNRPRAYAYYRCLGTDAYRFGGERICPNTQVRTDRLELAVWHEVCALLAQPERLRQEFERRRQATGESQRQERRYGNNLSSHFFTLGHNLDQRADLFSPQPTRYEAVSGPRHNGPLSRAYPPPVIGYKTCESPG